MKLIFTTVVSIITIILLATHYGFYKLTLVLFALGGTGAANWYFWILMFLAISFPLSNILVINRDNVFTRAYYYLSALWIGAFAYLLAGAVVAALLSIIFSVVGLPPFSPRWALAILALMMLVVIYAYRNAMIPRVKRVQVPISNLPDIWKQRRIVFVSDIHVGAILRRGFLQKVVNEINRLEPSLVLIGGDLFDGGGSKISSLIEPINELAPELGIFMITGNHETYIRQEIAVAAIKSTSIRLLRNEVVDIDGVQLVGIDYPTPGRPNNPEELLKQLDRKKPTILMFHEPRRIGLFKKYGVNLHLAGHTHRGQIWPFNHLTKLVYKGLDYGLHTDGDFNLYCSCGVGTWGPPFRTMSRSEIVLLELN